MALWRSVSARQTSVDPRGLQRQKIPLITSIFHFYRRIRRNFHLRTLRDTFFEIVHNSISTTWFNQSLSVNNQLSWLLANHCERYRCFLREDVTRDDGGVDSNSTIGTRDKFPKKRGRKRKRKQVTTSRRNPLGKFQDWSMVKQEGSWSIARLEEETVDSVSHLSKMHAAGERRESSIETSK